MGPIIAVGWVGPTKALTGKVWWTHHIRWLCGSQCSSYWEGWLDSPQRLAGWLGGPHRSSLMGDGWAPPKHLLGRSGGPTIVDGWVGPTIAVTGKVGRTHHSGWLAGWAPP
jgi:hypothetical protein